MWKTAVRIILAMLLATALDYMLVLDAVVSRILAFHSSVGCLHESGFEINPGS